MREPEITGGDIWVFGPFGEGGTVYFRDVVEVSIGDDTGERHRRVSFKLRDGKSHSGDVHRDDIQQLRNRFGSWAYRNGAKIIGREILILKGGQS